MKIIKSRLFSPRKCEYGAFELKPDDGWELSQTFIDRESGLLIVSVGDKNEANWEDLGFGGRRITNKQFVIDREKAEILEPSEWKKYFSYEKKVVETIDKRYRLITQRIHEPESNTDSIYEELEDLETGQISTSSGVAFRDQKRDNLLESYYRSIHEAQKQKELLDAKLLLEEFAWKEVEKLVEGDVIISYTDDSNTYKLTFSNRNFLLSQAKELPPDHTAWKSLRFTEIKTYDDLNGFWNDFSRDDNWFLKFRNYYGISGKPHVLAKHVISCFNDLRREHRFTYNEYEQINAWEHSFWSDEFKKSALKQWCSNCQAEVYFQARYPKYICRNCASKEITDDQGNLLEFSNTGFSGSLMIYRKNREGQVLSEDSSQQFCDCIIDNKRFFAQEERFGGIVIQVKE
ncbi:hypothetical protein D3C86_1190980 [compost metagenome]